MDIKIIKENDISIGYIPNVTSIIELPSKKLLIEGKRICDGCGHMDKVVYKTEESDKIQIIPTLEGDQL